jgi:hypothetical protein
MHSSNIMDTYPCSFNTDVLPIGGKYVSNGVFEILDDLRKKKKHKCQFRIDVCPSHSCPEYN